MRLPGVGAARPEERGAEGKAPRASFGEQSQPVSLIRRLRGPRSGISCIYPSVIVSKSYTENYLLSLKDEGTKPKSIFVFVAGRPHYHPSELLSRLDRGEEAWVPQLQSSDESADEGPIKPTLKQLPKGGTWWARYRSPVTYPSSESANSDNDQESEEEKLHRGSYPHRGGFQPKILRRNLFNNSKGSGSQSLKPKEAYKHGSQLKKSSQSHLGKTKAETGNANESSTKERAAGRDQQVSCPDCGQIFKSKISRANHQRIHTTMKAYTCPHCEERFSSKKVLDCHQKSHRAEVGHRPSYSLVKHQNMRLYECLACKKSFELKEQFLLHQKSHTTQQSHECPECGETFVCKELLDKHQNCHTTSKNNRKKDKKEGKIESAPETTKKKEKGIHHGQETPEGLLPDVTRHSGLAKHPKIPTQENYVCQHCGKRTKTKSSFVNHGKIHRGKQQPYPHLERGENTSQEKPLASHQETHVRGKLSLSSDSKDKMCPKDTPFPLRVPHRKNQPQLCQKCGKTFDSNYSFIRHQLTHSGQKPFRCAACGKAFIQMWHLKRHEKTHLTRKFPQQPVVRKVNHENSQPDRKLFKCSLCGKGFFQPKHLKTHKRIHLNEECRKLSSIMEITRAFSNFPSGTASKEKSQGDPLGKALLQLPGEVVGSPHTQELKRALLVALEERLDTGASEKHITTPVQLSRKFQEKILLGYGKISQAAKSERKPRRKDIFSTHQPRTCSKNAHSPSHKKEKNHDGWQLRPRASSMRKSKREIQLVGKRSKRCFCQREEREMVHPDASKPPRKVNCCDGPQRVSFSLFQGASKNQKPKDLCFKLPCQKTFSREAQMKVAKSVAQRDTVSVAQERKSLEANSGCRSCEKDKCKPSNVRDPAETQPVPPLSKSKTPQDHERFCPLNAYSNATAQNLGTASLAQQLGEIQNPRRIQKRVKGRRSVELQKKILRKLQSSPSEGKAA
ncbi:hypothetical protein NXF25_004733, partial [Crotalus adamanteus]